MVTLAESIWISTSGSVDERTTSNDSLSSTQSSSVIVNVKQISVSPPTVNVPLSTAGELKSLPSENQNACTSLFYVLLSLQSVLGAMLIILLRELFESHLLQLVP